MGDSIQAHRVTKLCATTSAAGREAWTAPLQTIQAEQTGAARPQAGVRVQAFSHCGNKFPVLLDRITIFATGLFRRTNAPGVEAPPPVTFVIKKSFERVATEVTSFVWSPPSFDDADGWLVQITGHLTHQWEVWAFIAGAGDARVQADLVAIVDRVGGAPGVSFGPNVAG